MSTYANQHTCVYMCVIVPCVHVSLCVTVPLAVPWVRAHLVTARSVTLSWGVGRGVHTDWELQWADGARLETRASNTTTLLAQPLRPITNYTFRYTILSSPTYTRTCLSM